MRPTTLLRHGLAWGALVLVATPAAAQPQAPPRLDFFGDPLPPGAVARFGGLRWRSGGIITALAYTPECDLIGASADWTLRVWDGTTGKEKARHPLYDRVVEVVALSKDGRFVAGIDGGGLWLWDRHTTASPQPWARLDPVSSVDKNVPWGALRVALSPDGEWLAAHYPRGKMLVWHRATRQVVHEAPESGQDIPFAGPVAFSPDSRFVARVGPRHTIQLVDHQAGKVWRDLDVRKLEVHQRPIITLVFSPDGRTLASGTEADLCLWELASGKARCHLRTLAYSHSGGACAFSQNSRLLAFADDGRREVRLCAVPSGQLVHTLKTGLPMAVHSLRFSPDDATLAATCEDCAIHRWDVGSGKRLDTLRGHAGSIEKLAVSPDQRWLATAGAEGALRLWDAATGKQSASLPEHPDGASALAGVAWSPDGTKLVGAARDGTVRIWEAAKKQQLVALKAASWPSLLAFDPAGQLLVCGGAQLFHWDVGKGQLLAAHERNGGGRAVTATADGAWIAWDSRDGIVLWDVAAGKPLRKLDNSAEARALAFSPDGKWLAVLHPYFEKRTAPVRILEVATGKVLHEPVVGGVSFLGRCLVFVKGEGLVCGDEDGRIRVWTGPGAKAFGPAVNSGAGRVMCLAGVEGGRYVVSGHVNGTALLWDVEALAKGQ
jgi:WD40 repeat protein